MSKVVITEGEIRAAVKKAIHENFLSTYRPGTTNKQPLVSLNETNARRMLDRHSSDGYIVVSACRSGVDFGLNPDETEKIARINNERTRQLMGLIKEKGYSYTPVYGGFIENKGTEDETNVYEQSVMIYNHDKKGNVGDMNDLINFGVEIAKKYNQDSILVKEPGKSPRYVTQSGETDFELGDDVSFNDFSQEYFTDLHKNTNKYSGDTDRKPTRFSFNEAYINPGPSGYSERHVRALNGEIFIN